MERMKVKHADRLNIWVHWTLLVGLLCSGLMLTLGLCILLTTGQARQNGPPETILVLLQQMLHGDGLAMLELGILMLILTPVMRVLVLAAGWLRLGDWRSSAVAWTVFAMLLASILLGVG